MARSVDYSWNLFLARAGHQRRFSERVCERSRLNFHFLNLWSRHQNMTIDPQLHGIVAAQPYPLVFATISGAHLYGFPSPDSDFDLRGAHVLPLEMIIGLHVHDETVEDSRVIEGLEMDIVSHDVRKFFGLLLKKNGYVLEQLFSPLIVHTTAEHAELKKICSPHPQPLSHPMGEGSVGSYTSPNPLPARGGEG